MRGRKRTPTPLKLVRGTYRSDRATPSEAIAAGSLEDVPPELTPAQKELWQYHVKHAPRGVLAAIDRELLKGLVVAIDQRDRAVAALAGQSQVVTTREGSKPNPLIAIAARQTHVILKTCSELGFTPTSRARISMPGKPPRDPAERYFS